MKNRFYGKYYKIISDNNYVLAFILSHSNGGDMIQIITPDGSYYIDDTKSIIVNDNIISFNANANDITITGKIELGELSPLESKVMGPFTYMPLECKHDIYSMRHTVNGTLSINGIEYTYSNSLGYIEGEIREEASLKNIFGIIPYFRILQ